MSLLYGIHDREGAHIVPPGGWCVDTIALSQNPKPAGYRAVRGDIHWIVRLNWGYGADGTIPLPIRYDDFAERCMRYVAKSAPGVHAWIIGNEPNQENERPGGVYITPAAYVRCFAACRDAIKPADSNARVIPAPIAPYHANPVNWLDYLAEMLQLVVKSGGCDGLALHAYTRGSNPANIVSDKTMDEPLAGQFSGFLTYRDALRAVPDALRRLPAYITEFNEYGPWDDRNTEVVQAAYREIDWWNQQQGTQKIHALVLYRWPKYDKWHIEGKQGVIEDFQAAVALGFESPAARDEKQFLPDIGTGPKPVSPPAPTLPPRDITAAFKQRVPHFTAYQELPGRQVYRLIRAEYVPDAARRFGPDHHILVDVIDEAGKRLMGVSVNFYWGDGMEIARVNKVAEPYGVDYGMNRHSHSYGVWVGDFRQASDDVFGMGLGTIEQPDWNHHVSYFLVFQRVTIPAAKVPQPTQPPSPDPVFSTIGVEKTGKEVPLLAHPIKDPARRVTSQRFGDNPDAYAQFGMAGHTGLDFAVPVGTPVVAVDDGQVQEAGELPDYGTYIKLRHPWGESLYAHLSNLGVTHGEYVSKGEPIALSGNSGNSTGPHLHFAMRLYPYKRGAPFDGFTDPAPYLQNTQAPQPPAQAAAIPALIKAAAHEFSVDWHLFAALVWAESSFRPDARSPAGALGLSQLMPATWVEWQKRVKAGNDVFDPRQNLRAGAAYLAWCLEQVDGDGWEAAVAYQWGAGNIAAGVPIPATTAEYANKVIFGRDLLRAVGA